MVGIVLNELFAPVTGAVVRAPECENAMPKCTIKYLSADKQSFTTTATSNNGIWFSENAPYGTMFSRSGQVGEVFGGLVENKVTIVVLQEPTVGL